MTLKNLRLEVKRLSISAGQKLAMCGILLVPAPDCSSPRISYLLRFLNLKLVTSGAESNLTPGLYFKDTG